MDGAGEGRGECSTIILLQLIDDMQKCGFRVAMLSHFHKKTENCTFLKHFSIFQIS